jgi:hypothetical protein
MLLVINFMNLKIKPAQFFESAHMNTLYVRVLIGLSVYMCINVYKLSYVYKKSFFFLFFL